MVLYLGFNIIYFLSLRIFRIPKWENVLEEHNMFIFCNIHAFITYVHIHFVSSILPYNTTHNRFDNVDSKTNFKRYSN